MKDRILNTSVMIKVQKTMWYFLFGMFSVSVILSFLKVKFANEFAEISIITVLALTAIRLFVLSELYRRAVLYRYWILSIVLFMILIGTILIRQFY